MHYNKLKEETKPSVVVKEVPKKVEPAHETANGSIQYDSDENSVGVSEKQETKTVSSVVIPLLIVLPYYFSII